MIEVLVQNSLLPEEQTEIRVMAILDTGYSGFLLIPKTLFKKLGLDKLQAKKIDATLADGSSVHLIGSYGSLVFPATDNIPVDGLIETTRGAKEILIGMEGIRRLSVELNCCGRMVNIQKCS